MRVFSCQNRVVNSGTTCWTGIGGDLMVRILFTDPTETYQHNDEDLVEGIRTLIRKARSSISIHGYSLKGFQERDLFDHELISKLKSGVSLKIYGDSKDEVEFVCSIYRMYDVEGFSFVHRLAEGHGKYHIKAVVVDGFLTYLGSANLSITGLHNSSEIGLIIEGNKVPEELEYYVQHLKNTGLISRV